MVDLYSRKYPMSSRSIEMGENCVALGQDAGCGIVDFSQIINLSPFYDERWGHRLRLERGKSDNLGRPSRILCVAHHHIHCGDATKYEKKK